MLTGQNERVCVEKCPLTMRHMAKRSGGCRTRRALAGRTPGGRSNTREPRSKSRSSRLPEQETTWTRTRAVALLGHTPSRAARGGRERWCWSDQQTRERRAGRDGQPAAAPTRSQQTRIIHKDTRANPQRAKRAVPIAGEKSKANSRQS